MERQRPEAAPGEFPEHALEALTIEDWDQNCDRQRSDGKVHLRSGSWYRRRLREHFVNCGGGLFLAKESPASCFELERLE